VEDDGLLWRRTVYGGTEEGIKIFTRMFEGKRSFVSSRPRRKDDHKEIGCGDVGGGIGLVRLGQDVAYWLVL